MTESVKDIKCEYIAKTVLCLLTSVGMTTFRLFCRPDCYWGFLRGVDLTHQLFIPLGYDSTGSRQVHAFDTSI